ncbi:MAG: class I SAM-dependent methyltransferase [Saprospiraceae bacterium]|nr:class I SAM-dependent methyltransferase [Saprospiraceae bacterium]
MMDRSPEMYDPGFVTQLFSDMSATYDRMNTITSFGFSIWWRKQCAAQLQLRPGMRVLDLMSGKGEVWPYILPSIGPEGSLIAVDFCADMTRFAQKRRDLFPNIQVEVLVEDALACSVPDNSVDALISTFGLKTFNEAQLERLASETRRMLKPGGVFSFIEVSTPQNPVLRRLYFFYLHRVIPRLGKLFLGNPETYRMLGIYTEAFGNCRGFATIAEQAGLEVRYMNYFGGCASGVSGKKL